MVRLKGLSYTAFVTNAACLTVWAFPEDKKSHKMVEHMVHHERYLYLQYMVLNSSSDSSEEDFFDEEEERT